MQRHAQFFIHDADEHGVLGQTQPVFHGFEKTHLLAHFIGGLQFGGHLINVALLAVGSSAVRAFVVGCGDQRGQQNTQHPLGNLFSANLHHVGVHMQRNVADGHQARALRRLRGTVDSDVVDIGTDGLDRAPGTLRLEAAPYQTQVVPQRQHHVLGVHDGYGVFKVDYSGDGGLHDQVFELAVLRVDLAAFVELELQLHAVVFQKELAELVSLQVEAYELGWVLQAGFGAVFGMASKGVFPVRVFGH